MNSLYLKIPDSFLNMAEYPPDNHQYYSGSPAKKFKKFLIDSSHGYCMYCGRKILVEGEDVSQVEHSVDKDGNYYQTSKETFLLNCKYNLAIACPACNMVYKKKIRKIDLKDRSVECDQDSCRDFCTLYRDARSQYIANNYLILQPLGHVMNGENCSFVYDLLNHCFKPSPDLEDVKARHLTANHIEVFHLNHERISLSVLEICEDVVLLFDNGVADKKAILLMLKRKNYSNYLAVLFLEWIEEHFVNTDKTLDELVDFCKLEIMLGSLI